MNHAMNPFALTRPLAIPLISALCFSCIKGDETSATREAPFAHEGFSHLGDMAGKKINWNYLTDREKLSFNTDWKTNDKGIPWTYQGLLWKDMSLAHRALGKRYIHADDRIPSLSEYFQWFSSTIQGDDEKLTGVLSVGEKYDYLLKLQSDPEYIKSERFQEILKAVAKLEKDLKAKEKQDNRPSEKLTQMEKMNNLLFMVKKFLEGNTRAARYLREDFPLVVDGWHKYAAKATETGRWHTGKKYEKPNGKTYKSWGWMGHCNGWATAAAFEKEPLHAVRAEIGGKKLLFLEYDIRSLLIKAWTHWMMPNTFIGTKCDSSPENIARDLETDRMLDGFFCTKSKKRECFQTKEYYRQATWFSNHKEFAVPVGDDIFLAYRFRQYTTLPMERDEEGKIIGNIRAQPEASDRYAIPLMFKELAGGKQKIEFPHFNSLAHRKRATEGQQIFNDKVYRFVKAYTFNTKEELIAFLQKPEKRKIEIMHHNRCRDINPMTFHLTLSDYLNDGKKGRRFIMDNTPGRIVWNVPVIGYETQFLDMEDSSKVVTLDSALQRATPESYPLFKFRAPGTKYIAKVNTRVIAQTSRSASKLPVVSYRLEDNSDFDQTEIEDLQTRYYLEFDAHKNVIGGEWDPVGMFDKPEDRTQKRRVPDYVMAFKGLSHSDDVARATREFYQNKTVRLDFLRNSKTVQYRLDLMRKIHTCSIDPDREVKTTQIAYRDKGSLKDVKFVECKLD